MGRRIGSKNITVTIDPLNTTMSLEERIAFLANLIADRIAKDQSSEVSLMMGLEAGYESTHS